MNRLGMPVSDDTILRLLKLRASARGAMTTIRVADIDDWSWRKGCTYGTIVVDLERREVVDVLPDRSTAGTAEWLSQHPKIEIISRDRGGLYAQGAREGAPQRGRSPIASISFKTCGRRSRPNSAAPTDQRAEPCCRHPKTKTKARRQQHMARRVDAKSRSIDALPSRRIVARGKPSLIKSGLYATPEALSATLLEKPGLVRAASENG